MNFNTSSLQSTKKIKIFTLLVLALFFGLLYFSFSNQQNQQHSPTFIYLTLLDDKGQYIAKVDILAKKVVQRSTYIHDRIVTFLEFDGYPDKLFAILNDEDEESPTSYADSYLTSFGKDGLSSNTLKLYLGYQVTDITSRFPDQNGFIAQGIRCCVEVEVEPPDSGDQRKITIKDKEYVGGTYVYREGVLTEGKIGGAPEPRHYFLGEDRNFIYGGRGSDKGILLPLPRNFDQEYSLENKAIRVYASPDETWAVLHIFNDKDKRIILRVNFVGQTVEKEMSFEAGQKYRVLGLSLDATKFYVVYYPTKAEKGKLIVYDSAKFNKLKNIKIEQNFYIPDARVAPVSGRYLLVPLAENDKSGPSQLLIVDTERDQVSFMNLNSFIQEIATD